MRLLAMKTGLEKVAISPAWKVLTAVLPITVRLLDMKTGLEREVVPKTERVEERVAGPCAVRLLVMKMGLEKEAVPRTVRVSDRVDAPLTANFSLTVRLLVSILLDTTVMVDIPLTMRLDPEDHKVALPVLLVMTTGAPKEMLVGETVIRALMLLWVPIRIFCELDPFCPQIRRSPTSAFVK